MPRRIWISLLFAAALGCGSKGPPTHRLQGRIELPGVEPAVLAGHYIEARLEASPDVVASGEISPEGTFQLESLHAGELYSGALEGKYQVRVVFADDDPARRRLAAEKVDARNLYYETSGLTLHVPSDNVVMKLQTRR